MQEYSIHIDVIRLSRLLQVTFEQLPKDYFKAYEGFLKIRSKSYCRESLISKWVGIPTSNNVVFKKIRGTFRLKNIFILTVKNTKAEFQIYVNSYGIIGVNIEDDLENLIIENTDTNQFIFEEVPVSNFLTDQIDLEYLNDFNEIDDYLDNKYTSQGFTIDGMHYYSIITLSDKNCIAIDNNKSVYLLNKMSGFVKKISKRPEEFVRAFKSNTIDWIERL